MSVSFVTLQRASNHGHGILHAPMENLAVRRAFALVQPQSPRLAQESQAWDVCPSSVGQFGQVYLLNYEWLCLSDLKVQEPLNQPDLNAQAQEPTRLRPVHPFLQIQSIHTAQHFHTQ